MLVVAVVFYVIGRMQGREPVPALEARASASEAQAATVQDRALLYEALALTYRAVLDLDDRNFGLANERLRAAARVLDGLSGVDGAAVDQLRRQMAGTNLAVAEDLAGQRARVLAFAAQIEALLQDRPPDAPVPPAE
jgi:hypothetical protein